MNHHPWIPGFEPPYVIAIVEIEEQSGLRVTTNLVGCTPDSDDGIFLPLFEPASDAKHRAQRAEGERSHKE